MPTKTIIAPSCLLMLIAALIVASMTACRSHEIEPGRSVVVNAPVDGIVRRVIVDSNAAVDKDAAIIEIALQPAHPVASNQHDAAASRAQYASAQTDLASAEGEANRIAADVRRIEPLVKRGLASQAELDKARSQSLDRSGCGSHARKPTTRLQIATGRQARSTKRFLSCALPRPGLFRQSTSMRARQ